MIIKSTVLNGDSSLFHKIWDILIFNYKTIISIATIFPEYFTVTVGVDIDWFRNLNIIQTNRIEIFFIIEEEPADCDNTNQKRSGASFKEEHKTLFTEHKLNHTLWMKTSEETSDWLFR